MAAQAEQPMVEARGLARAFQTRTGPVAAVAGADFAIARREIVGFLGSNGAGKTTTQPMLSTLLGPTAGEATVAGCDLRRDPVGVRLIAEVRFGVVERMRVTPASRLALLAGRVMRDVLVLASQAVLLIAIATVFGLRAPLGGLVLVTFHRESA
jgi:ABC-type Na+ transport system ATPase subunit NatA